MAKKVTQEQIKEMVKLYHELKTYTAVARQMGISTSTVSRYIKEQASIRKYDTYDIMPKPIEEIDTKSVLTFSFLTAAEIESYNNWIKEFK